MTGEFAQREIPVFSGDDAMPPAACGGVGEAECNPVVQSPHGGNVYSDTVKKRLYIIGELSDTGEGAIFV